MPYDTSRQRGTRRLASALLSAAGLSAASPAHGDVVRLASLEQTALSRRPALDVEIAKAKGARARLELAKAATRPTLSLNAGAGLEPGNTLIHVNDVNGSEYLVAGSRPIGRAGSFSAEPRYGSSLLLQGRIYDFGRSAESVEAAAAGERATRAESDVARSRILRQVRATYLDWSVARANADIAEKNAQNARERRRIVEARVDEGLRPASDLLPVRSADARGTLERLDAQARVTSARLALEAATGAPLPEGAEPDPTSLELSPPSAQLALPAELLGLERKRDAAVAAARAHGHRYAPVITGLAEAGVRGQRSDVFPAYRLNVSLSIALLDGGAETAQRDLARADAAQLAAQINDFNQSLSYEEARAVADFAAASERVRAADELRRAAIAEFDAAEARYELGALTPETVIDARALLTKAALEVVQARAARADAAWRLFELRNAAGALSH